MNPTNLNHIPIPKLRELFNATIGEDSWGDDGESQLDVYLNAPNSHFRLLHHLLIQTYSKATMHHRDTPIPLIGLDIETEYQTGKPMLFGYSYPDGHYVYNHKPTIESFYRTIDGIMDNAEYGTALGAWGKLDLNEIIRLFDPDKREQKFLSRGYGGRFKGGVWVNRPPIIRSVNGVDFAIDHYISGRSLRLSRVVSGRYKTIWVFNISQFFPTRIAETARALEFDWKEYDKETHLIDWGRFDIDTNFRRSVLESNNQDARAVRQMGEHLQTIFYQVFDTYPSLLVSTGSLADATVSKMLDADEYQANSWQYLKYSTFGNNETTRLAESLLSEAYSAGYVDQFAVGFTKESYIADISSAYPHKIRQLPDLRECYLLSGRGSIESAINEIRGRGDKVFTAVFRGIVTVPEHLEYQPITVKTSHRQNIRPLGTYRAAYFLEAREFDASHGATFEDETWVIFAVREWREAPIARVSNTLANMRNEYQDRLKYARESRANSEVIFYDSIQNLVKVVDNSLYGKTVMAIELVEDIDGEPVDVGLKAGDRFNMLYGGWITELTRIQIADACMKIKELGGSPVMVMTDSVMWTGSGKELPNDLISFHGKEAGKFEPPEKVYNTFVIKTGQYEYAKKSAKSPTGYIYTHKMRGLNAPDEDVDSQDSFFRKLIIDYLDKHGDYMHPEDIEIPVNTRKLLTIGMGDLQRLGLVSDGVSMLRPYVMSGKQVERFLLNYKDTLNGLVRLKPVIAKAPQDVDSPLEFLSGLNERGGDYVTRHERKRIFYLLIVKYTGLDISNRFGGRMPDEKLRLSDVSWSELEEWSGVKREWARL